MFFNNFDKKIFKHNKIIQHEQVYMPFYVALFLNNVFLT